MIMNPKQTRLQALMKEIQSQSPKTLAYWRLSNPELVQVLESFAGPSNDSPSLSLLEETQALFDKINPLLAQQEAESPTFLRERRRSTNDFSSSSPSIAVVFGGKYSDSPRTISELLVAKLAAKCSRVYTVSRTNIDPSTVPSNVTHIAKQHLDDEHLGADECKEILQQATAEWNQSSSRMGGFIIYFTLGQHKGENPFLRNLQAANNLAQALLDKSAFVVIPSDKPAPWKVVLTGTDATLPSTHPDGTISLEIENTQVDLTIPTYKIMKYNYTYAMSKLGQYYIVANTIAQRMRNEESLAVVTTMCLPIIEKIQRHVQAAGNDGEYHPDTAIVKMNELDSISEQVSSALIATLQDHNGHSYMQIAEGISICYTPLHAKPWTEQAMKQTSNNDTNNTDRSEQKAYVLEQIVKRLKNAVSIEHAVASHLG